ncbi:hypothetical protein GF323_02935 [Candidatus Woesearchaeota archaeon]|nr:hypothetical protein [Candidatus Woesearchaeota archaeon]
MRHFLVFLFIVFLSAGCYHDVKTGQSIEQKIIREENRELKAIDISDDPKKSEIMDFAAGFISSIAFPEVDGYPVKADQASFKMVGLTIEDDVYTVTTQFRLRTMKGPRNKQYTLKLRDLGNAYKILYVREDK